MSTSAAPGRTWFDPESDTLPQPGTHYLGLHVPLLHMRRNACTFNDFHTDHADRARRKLLRMFLRINFCLMADGKLGSGARAYLEWDADDALSIPTYFRVHAVYQVDDTDSGFPERAVEVLGKLIRSDSERQGKEGVRRNELVVRADSWAALCATYTGQLQVMGPNDLTCAAPCDVFQALRCGDRYMPGMYTPHKQTIQMSASDLNIDIFFEKYCPWYQSRQLPDVPLRCSTNPANAAQLLHLSRTVPEPLKDDLMSAWELLKERAERARGRERYLQWARAEIAHGLHGPQAGYVPKSESALNMHKTVPFPVAPYPDVTLSPFATWVVKFMMECETYTFMYKQHLLLLKLLLGSFDVAREAGNGQIHYSAILAGPNSTSKSYVFTLLEDLLIPGTVDRATRRTENSFTYNRDQGCRVLIEHEMSADFFGDSSSRKDSSARTSQTKEILTSHEATTEACQYVDGERVMVETRSRAHLCYLAATNDWSVGQSKAGESNRDSALVSRFDVIFPTRGGNVDNKSIMALMAADRDPTTLERQGKAQLVQWVRTMQQTNYWVHRMIHVGAIQPVNLDAVHAVVDQYSVYSQMAPRVIERIVIMARQCCIQTAVMTHYGYTASPRVGQPPQPSHLHELEPLLVVTAEQAKFALGLYEADLCNSVAEPFAIALRKLAFRPDTDLGFSYLRVLGCDSVDQLTDEIVMHIPDGHDVSRDLIVAYMDTLRQQTLMCHPYVPRIGTTHGVGPDRDKARQPAYRMRGVAIHVSMADATPARTQPLEDVIVQRCHIGPPGRELTTQCIAGHAHLLAVRSVHDNMKPYTKAGMYMPPESAAIMGDQSRETLCQAQRSSTSMHVNTPLETKELSRRKAPCMRVFAQKCANGAQEQRVYPDEYDSAYKRARHV